MITVHLRVRIGWSLIWIVGPESKGQTVPPPPKNKLDDRRSKTTEQKTLPCRTDRRSELSTRITTFEQ